MDAFRRSLFDDDHEALRQTVRRFLADEVVPNLDEWRSVGEVPQQIFARAGELGLLGTAVPAELGGGGSDDLLFGVALVEEAVAVGATGLAMIFAIHEGVCLPLLVDHGSEEQQADWVPGFSTGETISALAAVGRPLEAVSSGESLTIGGTVDGVTGAASAGLLVLAVQDNGVDRLVLVDPSADGVEHQPVRDSLAARDAGQADLRFDEVSLAATAVIGSGSVDPLDQVRRDLDLWSAVVGVAAARAVLRLTLDYVHERKVFGRPLAEFENTRHRLAELSAGIATAQLFVDTCLQQRAESRLSPADAATARLSAAAIHDLAVDQGMQLHGGYGYMREYPISHAFADARYVRLASQAGSDARDAVAASIGL